MYLLPIPSRMNAVEHYAYLRDFLTPEECDTVIAMGTDKWQVATTAGGDSTDKRRSQVAWLRWNQEQGWLWDKLARVVTDLNAQFFGFDLTAMAEELQLTKYEGTNEGHYGWHVDVGGGSMSIRKLSVVVQLTNPAEYVGGELEIFAAQQDKHLAPPKERGSIILFPSYEPHQVVPVTSGVRHSLVGWISGPPYR